MDLSIVVPAYNVEEYLERCIDSLVGLSEYNISNEIIIINDGSTDNTLLVAEKLKNKYKDENIILLNQENKGLSEARNVGLKIAKGEYISFIDSDDFLDKEEFVKLIKKTIKDAVFIGVGNFKVILNGINITQKRKEKQTDKIKTGKEMLKYLLKKEQLSIEVWNKIYKKSLLLNNNLFFKKDRLHEDEVFTIEVFLKANSVKLYDIYFYNYVKREKSITKNKSIKNYTDMEKNIFDIYELIKQETDLELKKYLTYKIDKLYKGIIRHTSKEKINFEFKKNYKKLVLEKKPITLKVVELKKRISYSIYKKYKLFKNKKIK